MGVGRGRIKKKRERESYDRSGGGGGGGGEGGRGKVRKGDMYLDISLQQKYKSFETNSTACSLDKYPLLPLMLKLPFWISSLCLKRRFLK